MLRSLGIPARLAVGYATGERNPFTGLYEVRAKDAHAWAEVYFPGVGWQAFDPTAQVPLAGDSSIDAAGAGALSYLNARIDIPGWVPLAAGALGLAIVVAIAIRLVVRRLRRRAGQVDPSWAAVRLAQLERLGAAARPAACAGRDHPGVRACPGPPGSVRLGRSCSKSARIIDAAMFSSRAAVSTDRDRGRRDPLATSRNGGARHRRPDERVLVDS